MRFGVFTLVFIRSFSVPVSEALPPVTDGIETLESSLNETHEDTKKQLKGFISQIRQMIQDKVIRECRNMSYWVKERDNKNRHMS